MESCRAARLLTYGTVRLQRRLGKHCIIGAASALCVALVAPRVVSAKEYVIDADHSSVGFKVRHLAISSVAGSFGEFSGKLYFDPGKIGESKTEATIRAASIFTAQQKRDEHLRSEDFLEVSKYPELKFVSKKVTPRDANHFVVVGYLTLHGVTKEVSLDVTYNGTSKDPQGRDRVAFSATTDLNRKDFGLTWNKVLETGALVVGEQVKVQIEVEAIEVA